MKVTPESITTLVTSLIGMCVMVFGMAQDVANVLQAAVPTVVGGVMSIVSVVTYLVNRRKAKEAVLNAAVAAGSFFNGNAKGGKKDVVGFAKDIGLI